jgi:hypothetical protein
MYTMILLLYLQQGLDVTLDHASLRGRYQRMSDCETAARALRGPVPIPHNYAAAWQDVLCFPIDANVTVNEMKPLDLAKALQAYAPLNCQADGAWERIAALCRGTGTPPQDASAAAPAAAPDPGGTADVAPAGRGPPADAGH